MIGSFLVRSRFAVLQNMPWVRHGTASVGKAPPWVCGVLRDIEQPLDCKHSCRSTLTPSGSFVSGPHLWVT